MGSPSACCLQASGLQEWGAQPAHMGLRMPLPRPCARALSGTMVSSRGCTTSFLKGNLTQLRHSLLRDPCQAQVFGSFHLQDLGCWHCSLVRVCHADSAPSPGHRHRCPSALPPRPLSPLPCHPPASSQSSSLSSLFHFILHFYFVFPILEKPCDILLSVFH